MLTRNPIISAVDRRSSLFRRPRTPNRRSWRWIGAAIETKFDDLEENIRLLLLEEALKAPIEARCCSKEFPIITNKNMNFCQPQNMFHFTFRTRKAFVTLPCIFVSSKSILFSCKYWRDRVLWKLMFEQRLCMMGSVFRQWLDFKPSGQKSNQRVQSADGWKSKHPWWNFRVAVRF